MKTFRLRSIHYFVDSNAWRIAGTAAIIVSVVTWYCAERIDLTISGFLIIFFGSHLLIKRYAKEWVELTISTEGLKVHWIHRALSMDRTDHFIPWKHIKTHGWVYGEYISFEIRFDNGGSTRFDFAGADLEELDKFNEAFIAEVIAFNKGIERKIATINAGQHPWQRQRIIDEQREKIIRETPQVGRTTGKTIIWLLIFALSIVGIFIAVKYGKRSVAYAVLIAMIGVLMVVSYLWQRSGPKNDTGG